MATGTVVKAWKDACWAHLAIRVKEADGRNVEYIGSVPLADLAGKPLGEQKGLLVAAAKAARDAQVATTGALSIAGVVAV